MIVSYSEWLDVAANFTEGTAPPDNQGAELNFTITASGNIVQVPSDDGINKPTAKFKAYITPVGLNLVADDPADQAALDQFVIDLQGNGN